MRISIPPIVGALLIFGMPGNDIGLAFVRRQNPPPGCGHSAFTQQALAVPYEEFIQPLTHGPLHHLQSDLARLQDEKRRNLAGRRGLRRELTKAKLFTEDEEKLVRERTRLEHELGQYELRRDAISHQMRGLRIPFRRIQAIDRPELGSLGQSLREARAECGRLHEQIRQINDNLAGHRQARVDEQLRLRRSLNELKSEFQGHKNRVQDLRKILAPGRTKSAAQPAAAGKPARKSGERQASRADADTVRKLRHIGMKLRTYRVGIPSTARLSMADFARRAGLSNSAELRAYEFGKRVFTEEVARSFGRILGVDHGEFLLPPPGASKGFRFPASAAQLSGLLGPRHSPKRLPQFPPLFDPAWRAMHQDGGQADDAIQPGAAHEDIVSAVARLLRARLGESAVIAELTGAGLYEIQYVRGGSLASASIEYAGDSDGLTGVAKATITLEVDPGHPFAYLAILRKWIGIAVIHELVSHMPLSLPASRSLYANGLIDLFTSMVIVERANDFRCFENERLESAFYLLNAVLSMLMPAGEPPLREIRRVIGKSTEGRLFEKLLVGCRIILSRAGFAEQWELLIPRVQSQVAAGDAYAVLDFQRWTPVDKEMVLNWARDLIRLARMSADPSALSFGKPGAADVKRSA